MSCGKKSYQNEEIALDALVQNRILNVYSSAKTIYRCDECGLYHLTSKGEIHPILHKKMGSGSIQKESEAKSWEEKLKRKFKF
ncbi:MAG: hypothetical protein ACRCVT_10460 [Leadbetterella sp.]